MVEVNRATSGRAEGLLGSSPGVLSLWGWFAVVLHGKADARLHHTTRVLPQWIYLAGLLRVSGVRRAVVRDCNTRVLRTDILHEVYGRWRRAGVCDHLMTELEAE
ncbi:hypothetical protein GCM10008955_41590 [Deinococcus malanensis]|uniref:Uncharacterized protein n=1 Tax=Deinococcus malanensis TaxID=1706855 RepID=A0ABQ2F616_9DEIO|nr:hypothetical protein GCM10008955_41590 [Deinococcus malanensis]